MKLRFYKITGVVLAGLVSLVVAQSKPAVDPPLRYQRSERIATLANRQIRESSGLAVSRATPGAFWTNNDSGDAPRVYAVNRKGESLATLTLQNAQAVDWEDMCSYTLGNKHYLLLADVGDNKEKRKSCTLYIVEEPRLDPTKRNANLTARPAVTLNFTYEDGPRDCESVAVDPITKQILLVSKRGDKRFVYTLPIPAETPGETIAAVKIASLTIPETTAMDISPDGKRAVVLTYLSAYEYTRRDGETWAQAFARAGRLLLMPLRRQGETICYGLDGKTLYLTSEQLPTPLIEIKPK
jgi:hypothetical protein